MGYEYVQIIKVIVTGLLQDDTRLLVAASSDGCTLIYRYDSIIYASMGSSQQSIFF